MQFDSSYLLYISHYVHPCGINTSSEALVFLFVSSLPLCCQQIVKKRVLLNLFHITESHKISELITQKRHNFCL